MSKGTGALGMPLKYWSKSVRGSRTMLCGAPAEFGCAGAAPALAVVACCAATIGGVVAGFVCDWLAGAPLGAFCCAEAIGVGTLVASAAFDATPAPGALHA